MSYDHGFKSHVETKNDRAIRKEMYDHWEASELGNRPHPRNGYGSREGTTLIRGLSAFYKIEGHDEKGPIWCLWINAEATEVFEEHAEL